MDVHKLQSLLERVRQSELPVQEALQELAELPYLDLGFARLDQHRQLRQGVPEVIYAEGKQPEHLLGIVRALRARDQAVLLTRLSAEQSTLLEAELPFGTVNRQARTARFAGVVPEHRSQGKIAVVAAGTADYPVAMEAVETLRACGVEPDVLHDVGVAGLHRLLPEVSRLRRAQAVLVIAGMEGALASVVGGLVAAPVIAVPTSVGYGAALGGLAALLGMLTTCAAGVTVVNIDNGFGGAMAALRILDVAVSEKAVREEATAVQEEGAST